MTSCNGRHWATLLLICFSPSDVILNFRNGGIVAASGPKAFPPSAPKASSPRESTSQSPDNAVPGALASTEPKDIDGFDEFDPRGSVSGIADHLC